MARILVIEDNPDNLELMTYLLKAFGHQTLSAGDGMAGVEMARAELPELIICDVHLPKRDGYQVAGELKSDPALQYIPLVAVTALAMVGDRDKVLAAGFDGYIAKPITPEKFVDQVEAFLPPQPPRVLTPPASEPATDGDIPRQAQGRLLVVDNSEVNRELYRQTFEPVGYEVSLASSAEEGLSMAAQDPPDLVVSDLHMPGIGGFGFVQALRAQPLFANLPFVMISASVWGVKDRVKAKELGVTRFIQRPIEPHLLLEEIAACLSSDADQSDGNDSGG